MEFDPDKPFRACLLCGDVYQSGLDRTPNPTDNQIAVAAHYRQVWAEGHAKMQHKELEHRLLQISGMSMTPEAANKLAAFGLLPITDMAKFDEEIASALMESHPIPKDDVIGST